MKFLKWFLHDILLPLSPLALRALLNIFAHTKLIVINECELFFYSIALCVIAIVQIKGNRPSGVFVKTICYICIVTSFIFMTVIYLGSATDETRYLSFSIVGLAVLASSVSMLLMKDSSEPKDIIQQQQRKVG